VRESHLVVLSICTDVSSQTMHKIVLVRKRPAASITDITLSQVCVSDSDRGRGRMAIVHTSAVVDGIRYFFLLACD
jgi:hypothetical protein